MTNRLRLDGIRHCKQIDGPTVRHIQLCYICYMLMLNMIYTSHSRYNIIDFVEQISIICNTMCWMFTSRFGMFCDLMLLLFDDRHKRRTERNQHTHTCTHTHIPNAQHLSENASTQCTQIILLLMGTNVRDHFQYLQFTFWGHLRSSTP